MSYTTHAGDAGDAAARLFLDGAGTLLDRGLELTLAVALGSLLSRWLRRRGLHWSWAATALAPVVALHSELGALGTATIASLATAAWRGRRAHRDDVDAGQDLARIARERVTPAAALRVRLARCVRKNATSTLRGRDREMLLGCEHDGRSVTVPFAARAATHTLVVGATGSGKTVTQTSIAVHAIEQGRGVIAIDPKGDVSMREQLRDAAARAGREFVEWTPSGPTAYNPYARGGETEIADRLLAAERFTEPHYLRQAQRYVGHAVRALRACDVEVSLGAIVEALDAPALEELLRHAPEQLALAGHAYLDSLTARQLRDLAGVRDRLAILAESDAGRWLEPAGGVQGEQRKERRRVASGDRDERPTLDLLDAARARAVVYVALETDTRPLVAQMLGAAIVQDLQSVVAAMQLAPVPTLVVIDEFAAVSAEHVVALFGRARSAGISLLLGTQEIADLRLPGRERTLEQVMGNLSLLIAHRQVVPDSAELLSRLGGSRGAWRVSWSSGGRSTRTRTHEPRLAPDQLSDMAPGWAAVIPFGGTSQARIARVLPRGGDRR